MSDTVSVDWGKFAKSGDSETDFNIILIFSLLIAVTGLILNDWRFAAVGIIGVVLSG